MNRLLSRVAVLALVALGSMAVLAEQPANIPQQLSTLADQPATHLSFSFDRSMLDSASAFLDGSGSPVGNATAQLHSITVDTYHYPHAAFYTPEAMNGIIATYHAAGWKHLVDAHTTPAMSAQPNHSITDLWLHFNGMEIDDVTVLTRGARDMNLIQISCALRPLDLLHLSGHFGIPKVDPNAVMVPAPDGR
ncbi:MAG: hypothetical protein PW789_08035 [Edaphobacter sp.]|uniref:hypothetical protein n=1 Tax=Edaphobacter sp. TaxID=1934404 RepID=UPI00239260FF|nr:hypothetical protein [Edaphobacter sp.]MDE1176543.1 hypothetical protein [Edaphobacter sp.]